MCDKHLVKIIIIIIKEKKRKPIMANREREYLVPSQATSDWYSFIFPLKFIIGPVFIPLTIQTNLLRHGKKHRGRIMSHIVK